MKNKKIERAIDALEGIFDLKKNIEKSVSNAKDNAVSFGLDGLGLIKEFSDSIEELFKKEEEPKQDDVIDVPAENTNAKD